MPEFKVQLFNTVIVSCFLALFSPLLFYSPYYSEFSSSNHQAGSLGDEALGNKVLGKFREYGMNNWNDEHFVKVHDAPVSGYNKFTFKSGNEERPAGFLSYSANGTVTVMCRLLC